MKLQHLALLGALIATPALAISNLNIYCPAMVHCEDGHCYAIPVNKANNNFVDFGDNNSGTHEENYHFVAAIDKFGNEQFGASTNCVYMPNDNLIMAHLSSKNYAIANTKIQKQFWQTENDGTSICASTNPKSCPFLVTKQQ